MARNTKIQLLRTTKSALETEKSNSNLLVGEPYFITDENKLVIGTSTNNYTELATNLLSTGITTTPPNITLSSGLIYTIPTCECNLYDNINFTGTIKHYTILQANVTLVDNEVNYIYIDYNDGTPIYKNTTDVNDINESNTIPVNTILMTNQFAHLSHWDSLGNGLANKLHRRLVKTQRYVKEPGSGLTISYTGTNTLAISGGTVWRGGRDFTLQPVQVNSLDAYSFWYVYTHDSATTWNVTVNPTEPIINHAQYDSIVSPFGLTTITNQNYYTINWIFRGVEDHNHGYIVLGNKEYKDKADATAETTLPELPLQITSHAILVGRILCKADGSTYNIENTADTFFQGTVINDHNNLGSIDGGIPTEYYHLSNAQHTIATRASTTLVDGYLTANDYNKFNDKLSTSNISDTAYDATSWDSVTTIAPSKNAVRDELENKVNTTRTINGLPLTNDITISSSGGFVSKFYFCDDDMSAIVPTSTIGTFTNIIWHELESTPDVTNLNTHNAIALPVAGTITQLDRYVTTNALGLTTLPAGEWIFDVWAFVTTGSARFNIYLYKVTSLGIATQIATGTSSTFSNTAATIISTRMFTPEQIGWSDTDRLGVVVAASRVTNNPSITFIHNKTTGQVSTMTSPVVITHNQLNGLNVGDYQHLSANEKSFIPIQTNAINANKAVLINGDGSGLSYSNVMTNTMTAANQIIYGDTNGVPAATTGTPANGQVLTISGGVPAWVSRFSTVISAAAFDLVGVATEPTLIGVSGTNRKYTELQFDGAAVANLIAYFEIPSQYTANYAGGSVKLTLDARYLTVTDTKKFVFSAGIVGIGDSESIDVAPPTTGNGYAQTTTTISTATDAAGDRRFITITIAADTSFVAGENWVCYLSRKVTVNSTPEVDDFVGIIGVSSVVIYE